MSEDQIKRMLDSLDRLADAQSRMNERHSEFSGSLGRLEGEMVGVKKDIREISKTTSDLKKHRRAKMLGILLLNASILSPIVMGGVEIYASQKRLDVEIKIVKDLFKIKER